MKAAPGDASQDGGLHKHLGRANPEHQPQVPDPARHCPSAGAAAGANPGALMELFAFQGLKTSARPMQD